MFEQLDDKSGKHSKYKRYVKKLQHRVERHLAKIEPEIIPCYNKYRGYET